jgi:transposase
MQYRTVIVADVPRVRCATHGVVQCKVPWADEGSRLTALFEALVIDWLHEASVAAVARMLRLSWDEVSGVQRRAVRRGLARREFEPPRRIGVDETSFQKRHEYITVVNDLERQRVLHLADGRGRDVLDGFYGEVLGEAGRRRLEAIAMNMWGPYIRSTKAHVPDAEAKIVFDKFHIASHLGTAVDEVRRAENRELRRAGDNRLVGTKYDWLRNPWNMSRSTWQAFAPLRTSQLRVARAWAIKETAMSLWGYLRRGWSERMWRRWYGWAIRSRLEPVKRVARTIRRHWYGVINAATTSTTNARAESINSKIQWVKRMAIGYRHREAFHNAIYFHLGGLDLYPQALASTHTKA